MNPTLFLYQPLMRSWRHHGKDFSLKLPVHSQLNVDIITALFHFLFLLIAFRPMMCFRNKLYNCRLWSSPLLKLLESNTQNYLPKENQRTTNGSVDFRRRLTTARSDWTDNQWSHVTSPRVSVDRLRVQHVRPLISLIILHYVKTPAASALDNFQVGEGKRW